MAGMLPLLEKMQSFNELEQVQFVIKQMLDLMEETLKMVEQQYQMSATSKC